jgi:HAD superfamily hydrolase (TIGR01549 family)
MKTFIFDLDQTIVETDYLERYRNERNWPKVYEQIEIYPIRIYEGITEIIEKAKNQGVKIAIVTSSPRPYALKLLIKGRLHYDTLICYHDTQNKKPHPEPIIIALNNLMISPVNYKDVYSFGDRDIDIIASNKAGVQSVACYWGANDRASLDGSNPNLKVTKPIDILNLLQF